MKLRNLPVIALCIFLFSLAFSGVANAASEETQTVYDINYGGLHVTIIAPVEASPGENITVNVKTSASDTPQIYVNRINLTFYGVLNSTTRTTFTEIAHLTDASISSHEANYTIAIPSDIAPGLTCGEISCDWKALGASFEIPSSGFPLTFIRNVALEQLQEEHDELSAAHQSLVQNYTDLESSYNELESDYTQLSSEVNNTDSAHSLMWVFVATTVIAFITIVVLLLRKPNRVWA